ncbi:hypothetical protein [Leptospira stimsonii]|uniref:Uncharacterized protein n=1 Tax=Leptospira stimsonii TaxID=2202203 RepID=A0A8B3CHD0_9LEPT|nr:hypothetical protein [Leptospira stimsonii]RHX83240.1 hypothetical protein DLM78_22300 [Leptospira stimsonii]
MFKYYLVILSLVFSFNMVQGESENSSGEQTSKEELYFLEDKSVLFDLIEDIRKFRHLNSDTTLQTETKVKYLKEMRNQINNKLKGRLIHFKWVELKDVRPVEKIQLRPGEKLGMYQSEYTISDPNNLGFDGFTVKNEEPNQNSIEGQIQVRISKFHPNKESVLNLKKHSKGELSGKIRKFIYSGGHSTYYDSEGGPYEIIVLELE